MLAGLGEQKNDSQTCLGRVKLLINRDTGEAVAMKVVDLARHPDAVDAVRKEMCLHRMLKNPSIIKFYGKYWFCICLCIWGCGSQEKVM